MKLLVVTLGCIASVAFAAAPVQPETPPSSPPAAAPHATDPPDKDKAPEPAADPEFDKQLAEIDQRAEKIETLRGKFVQKKHTPLMKKPLVSSGKFVVKGDRTRWETQEPRKSMMTIDPSGLRLYYPDQRVIEVYELGGDVREFSGSALPRLAKLRDSFTIAAGKVPADVQDREKLMAIELTPKTAELKKHVARVRVLIDTTIPTARRIEVEDVDGERTEIEFTAIEMNARVEDESLALGAPEGTRVVHPLGGGAPEPEKPKERDK